MIRYILLLFGFIPFLCQSQNPDGKKVSFTVRDKHFLTITGTQLGIGTCKKFKCIKFTVHNVYFDNCYNYPTYADSSFKADSLVELNSNPFFKRLYQITDDELDLMKPIHQTKEKTLQTIKSQQDSINTGLPEVLYTIEMYEDQDYKKYYFTELAEEYPSYYIDFLRNIEKLLGYEKEYK